MQAIAAEAGAEHGADNTAAQPFYRLFRPCHMSAGLLLLYVHHLEAEYAAVLAFPCPQAVVGFSCLPF